MKATGSSFFPVMKAKRNNYKEKEHSHKGRKKLNMRGKIILTDHLKECQNLDLIHSLSGREVSPVPCRRNLDFLCVLCQNRAML